MEVIRIDGTGDVPRGSRVILRQPLLKQIQRTQIFVEGVAHRLHVVDVRATDAGRETILITVTTDNTRDCAHVHISRDRLEYPDFVASLLAHAMRAVLMNELPPDGVEAF